MEITEVRIKLVASKSDKLRAFCSITIDDAFVIRDLKIIEGGKGPFVAMPSRKLMERCHRCTGKNHHRANFCNECGVKLSWPTATDEASPRQKLHADIAHPIHSRCRELIQQRVVDEYEAELVRSRDPNYRPPELDVFEQEALGEPVTVTDGHPDRSGEPERSTYTPPSFAPSSTSAAASLDDEFAVEPSDQAVPFSHEATSTGGQGASRFGVRRGPQSAPRGGGADRRRQGGDGAGRRGQPRRGGRDSRFGDGGRERQGGFRERSDAREPRRADVEPPMFGGLFAGVPASPSVGGVGGSDRSSERHQLETLSPGAPAPGAERPQGEAPPLAPRARPAQAPEPEDNFGVGLFS